MKKTILITVISLGIFAVAGCGKTSENTNTAVTNTAMNGNTAGKANTATTKSEEPPKNVLKPGDVSSDKAVKIPELVDSLIADKDAWMGKEITVTGSVSGTNGDTGNFLVTMINDLKKIDNNTVNCDLIGATGGNALVGKTIEVKGKIKKFSSDGKFSILVLDPCEVKK